MARKRDKGTSFNGAYLGLDPTVFALANYHCRKCSTAFTSNDGIIIMCPNCGNTAQKQKGKVQASAIEAFKIATCPTCASQLHANLEPDEIVETETFHCPECGDNVTVSEDILDEDVIDETGEDEDVDDLDEADEDLDEMEAALDDDSEDFDDEDFEEDFEDEDLEDEDLEDIEGADEEVEIVDEADLEDENEDEVLEEDEAAMSSAIKKILQAPLKDREALSMDIWHVKDDAIRNVVINGMPVARIHLKDQEDPASLQDVFAEAIYVDAIAESMIAKSVGEVLQESRARVLKGLKEAGVVPREKEVEASVTMRMNNFRKNFKETFLTVMAGVNRNHFPDVTNTLKMGLWEAMAEIGVESPETLVEKVFDEAAEPFIDQVFDKTLDLMNKPEEVRQEIMAMVNESGTKPVKSEMDHGMARKLAQSSFAINLGKLGADTRSDLRAKLRLRGK